MRVRRATVVWFWWGVSLTSGAVQAAEPAAELAPLLEPSASAITFAVSPVLSLADFCQRDSDVVGCSARGFIAGELAGRVRLNESWSVGPSAFLGVELGSRGIGSSATSLALPGEASTSQTTSTTFTSQLGGIGVVAHYHPFGNGLWVAPRAGSILLRDIADESVNGAPPTRSSRYHIGAELGVGLGYDWHVVEAFALTASLRASQALFPEPESLPGDRSTTVSSGPLVLLAVGGWIGL